jgi:hypothetical protein
VALPSLPSAEKINRAPHGAAWRKSGLSALICLLVSVFGCVLKFVLNPTAGEVSDPADVAFDHETRTDETFIVRVNRNLDDGQGDLLWRDFTITIPVADVNEAPVIDENTPEEITVAVGETDVISLTATDPDADEELSWQLSGDDVTHFNINNDGILSWKNPPTTGQLSADLDNVFEVIATVNDDEGLQDLIYLSITLV